MNYLDRLQVKPNPKSVSENIVQVQFEDKRDTTNVNRALVLSKVNAYIGLVADKRKINTTPIRVPDMTVPVYNPPRMEDALKPLPVSTAEPVVEPVIKEKEEQKEQEAETETEAVQLPKTVPESKQLVEPDKTVVPPVEQELPTKPVEKEPVPEPEAEKTAVAPAPPAPKRRPRLKIIDKGIAKPIDLTAATINGQPVMDRLPKPEKIILKAPSYYMSNRKIYVQKLNELFKEYNQQLIDAAAVASCDPKTKTNETELMIHQKVVRDYLNLYTPYRGLLLYFGLGAGKTAASIAIAEGLKSHKKVFILTPASLKMNYFSELKKYGDPLFRKNQFWEFVSTEGNPEYIDILSQVLSLPREWVVKNKGAWLVDITKTNANFKDLDANKQQMLDEQLNYMIRSKYIDINYNGLNTDKLNALVEKYGANPFDHSVVVVDEAHNLVSRIINKRNKPSAISSRIYQMLMSATDVRIVLLSGTPIINYPAEVGVLFNILRGYITTWAFTLKPPAGFQTEDILKILDDEDFRHYDYVDYTNGVLSITRNPFGFTYVKKSGAEKGQKHPREQPAVPEFIPPTEVQPAKPKKKLVVKPAPAPAPAPEPAPVAGVQNTIANATKAVGSLFSGGNGRGKTKKHMLSIQEQVPTTFLRKTRKLRIGVSTETQPQPLQEPGSETMPEPEDPIVSSPPNQGDEYYVVENGLIRLKEPAPEPEEEINETVEKETEKEYLKHQNLEGEYGMIRGGADLVFNRYKGIHLDEQGNISNEVFVSELKRILRKHNVEVSDVVKTEHYKCLPDTVEDFNSQFVDIDAVVMKDVNLFKKRVLGLTSYYRSAQESLLPQLIQTEKGETYHIIKCPMSQFQIEEYEEKRLSEMEIEKSLRKNAKKRTTRDELEDKISSTYRIYSRVTCTFVFPQSLPRPMPFKTTNIDEMLENAKKQTQGFEVGAETVLDNIVNETDEQLDVADNQSVPAVSEEYAKKIKDTMARLKTEKTSITVSETGEIKDVDVLSREGLKVHGPKYAEVLEQLEKEEHRGLHLLYSNFRTMEGVGIMKLVLEKEGYNEFKLKKNGTEWELEPPQGDPSKPYFALYTGTETAEEKEIVRNVYNSNWELIPPKLADALRQRNANNYYGEIIKILMITASGAEGINLENTRFVHILEPYWHMTRLDQVVGRARRICSHKNLPEELRTVQVFLYVAVFTEEQVKGRKHIELMTGDVSRLTSQPITTDEYLFESALIKYNLNNQILRSIKETAIDCNLYSTLNRGENLVCYGNQYGKVASNDFGAYPSLEKDRKEREELNVKETTVKLTKVTIQGVAYVLNKQTQELFDFSVYSNSKQLVLVGYLREDGKGGKIVVPAK